jgi:SAM-dependent methyltransferase
MDPKEAAQRSARVAAVFDRVADTYDAVGIPWFTPIAERLVAELVPAPGERALDIGTGRGAALWALAEAVGATGHVTGLDLAEAMVAATRREAAERGLTTVSLVVADAAAPDLPDASFDLAVASLVLFFLPDPPAAVGSVCPRSGHEMPPGNSSTTSSHRSSRRSCSTLARAGRVGRSPAMPASRSFWPPRASPTCAPHISSRP